MNRDTFNKLLLDAQEVNSAEQLLAELGWCEWMEEYEEDTDQCINDIENIYLLSHMTFKQLRAASNMTQAAIARRFLIPQRTIENWEVRNTCPHYIIMLLAEVFGLITVTITD